VGPRIEAGGPAPLALFWTAVVLTAATVLWLSPFVLHRDPPGRSPSPAGRARDDPGIWRNAWPAWLGLTALGLAAILAAAVQRDHNLVEHVQWKGMGVKLLVYLVSAPIQDLVVFAFLLTRLRGLAVAALGEVAAVRPLAALAAAGLFAAAHAPNWPFAAVVLAGGLCGSWLYQTRPNIVLAGIGHAVLGTALHSLLHLNMRVGPFYAHPEGHIMRHVIPGAKAIAGYVGW
jgi:hypothetical protein